MIGRNIARKVIRNLTHPIGLGWSAGADPASDITAILTSYASSRYSTGLSAMYEDAAGTIPAVTDARIGYVSDAEAHLNAFTQATSAAKPILRTYSALPCLEFDGIDDGLDCASAIVSGNSSLTLSMGVRCQNVVGTAVPLSLRGATANPMINLELVDGVPRARIRDDAGTLITLNSGLSSQAWADSTLTLEKSGSTWALKVNGTAVATDSTAIGTITLTKTALGYDPVDVSGFMEGLVTSLIVDGNQAIAGADLTSIEAWLTANNNIAASAVTISVDDITVAESVGNAAFTVVLNRSSISAVTVDYATTDDTAIAGADYTSTSGTLTFSPGETIKTVNVPITNDATGEISEQFYLDLSNPSGATIADSRGTCTISLSDMAQPVAFTGTQQLSAPSGFVGAVNSPYATWAMRVKLDAAADEAFIGLVGASRMQRRPSTGITGVIRNTYTYTDAATQTSNTLSANYDKTSGLDSSQGWRTIIVSIDLLNGILDLNINGTNTRTTGISGNGAANLLRINDAFTLLSTAFLGKAEWLFVHLGKYVDLSVPANVANFTYSNMTTANANNVTGTQPTFVMSGDASVWNSGVNQGGSGGDVVVTGTLTNTNP